MSAQRALFVAESAPNLHARSTASASASAMLDGSLFSLLSVLKLSFFAHLDDDLVDRFNYYYTPLLLVLFAIVSGSKQFFGHPIECLLPQLLANSGMESYAEQVSLLLLYSTYYS